MKVKTATLIFIRLIKCTLETSQPYEELNRDIEYSMMQDHTNSSATANNVNSNSYQRDCISAPLKNTAGKLEKDEKKVVQVLSEYVYNPSEKDKSWKRKQNSDGSSSENIMQQNMNRKLSSLEEPETQISKKRKVNKEFSGLTIEQMIEVYGVKGYTGLSDEPNLLLYAKESQTDAHISRKTKMNTKLRALTIEQMIELYNVLGYTGFLDETNPSTEKRTLSQQQPSVLTEPAIVEHTSMKSAQPSQEIESSHNNSSQKPLVYRIEVMSDQKEKKNNNYIWYVADIQSNLDISVITSLEFTNSNKKSKNIWSWIKNRIKQGQNVYTDFCTPQIYKEIFNLEKLTGYYNGFADDLKEYIEEHRPRTEAEYKKQIGKNKSICRYTLGDLYMKQELNTDSITECKTNSEKEYDCKSLTDMVQAIFNIPEIYQDLKSMPDNTFTETLENAKQLDGLTLIQVALLEYLYSILHSKRNSKEHLSALENAIISGGRIPSNYTIEELYKEAYKAMIVFYKHVPYFYVSKDNRRIEMMGKDVVVEQACMKCEAVVAKDGVAVNSPFRITSPPKYTAMPQHWNVSTKMLNHYHIQFVDNSLHTLRRVCLPFFTSKNNGNHPVYFHTIKDIIEYLAKIYNIEEKDKIYALAIEENSSTWRIITDNDKNRTIKYLKEKKSSVVFYYIKEGLEDKNLTPCVFKGPEDSQKKDKQPLPLFLSPFMECAMEQLGPYSRKEKYDSAEKPKLVLEETYKEIHVYEYTRPGNDNLVSGTIYSQTQLYYSRFYVDENIKEHIELCPILSISRQELKKTNKKTNREEKQYNLTWYVRTPNSSQEYTHYYFDKEHIANTKNQAYITIETVLEKLKEKSYTTDNKVYAFYSYYPNEKKSCWTKVLFQKKDKENMTNRISVVYNSFLEIVAFKTFNNTKVNLSIHNKILRVLLNKTKSNRDEEITL